VSRVLAENLNLREEILRLQNQLIASQPALETSEVDNVKSQLQAKLEEIGSLVAGLGLLQRAERPKRPQDPSTWRPVVPNLYLSGQEPRMPAIAEDKYYPRRTLEAAEIRALRVSDQSNESPDLGPPPVAHFDCEDPIKFDPPAPKEPARKELEDEENIPAEMSVNLETRRKRKDSQSRVESTGETSASEQGTSNETVPIRTSTKRKLNVRDSDEMQKLAPVEDFRYSRRSSITGDVSKPKGVRESDIMPGLKERKVLGDSKLRFGPCECLLLTIIRKRQYVTAKSSCVVEAWQNERRYGGKTSSQSRLDQGASS